MSVRNNLPVGLTRWLDPPAAAGSKVGRDEPLIRDRIETIPVPAAFHVRQKDAVRAADLPAKLAAPRPAP